MEDFASRWSGAKQAHDARHAQRYRGKRLRFSPLRVQNESTWRGLHAGKNAKGVMALQSRDADRSAERLDGNAF